MSQPAIENSDGTRHESVIGASDYSPIDRRNEPLGTGVVDDRSQYEKHQGHSYYPQYPQREEKSRDELDTQKRVEDRKRNEVLNKMSMDERHLYILAEQRADKAAAEGKVAADKQAASEWSEKHSEKIAKLKAIREEMSESGNGWKASELYKVDDCIQQLSAVGSCEATGQKMYEEAIVSFNAKQTQIETAIQAQLMVAQNKIDATRKRLGIQTVEPEPEINAEDALFKAHYKAVQEAKAAGDSGLVNHLRMTYWEAKIDRDKAAREDTNGND